MNNNIDLNRFFGIEEDKKICSSDAIDLDYAYRIHDNKIQQKENDWADSPAALNQFIIPFISETKNGTIQVYWKPNMNELVYIRHW